MVHLIISSKSVKKRAVIYRRVSTDDQKDNGFSLQSQTNRLKEKMTNDGAEAVHEPIEDVESGRNFERKGLKVLMRLAREGSIDFAYVYDLDRLGRDVIETPYLMHRLNKMGVIIRDINEEYNFDDPIQYLFVMIKCYRGHAESIRIGNRTQEGKIEKFKEGKWVGPAPFGYRVNAIGFLEKRFDIEAMLRDFFQIIASTGDYKRAAQQINQKYSDRIGLITVNKLKTIVQNPAYIGMPRYGKTQIEAPHLRIIPQDLWDKVQSQAEAKAKRRKPKGRRKPYSILDDFAREYGLDYLVCVLRELKPVCPRCGSLMAGNGSKNILGLNVPNFLCKNRNCRYEKPIPSGQELEHFLKKLISCPVCRSTENYNKTLALDGSIKYDCRRCGTSFQFTSNRATKQTSEIPNHEGEDYIKGEQPTSKLSDDSFKQSQKMDKIRLQKAVETAISAGYQLSKEAFDFLNETDATRDPVERVREVIRRLEELQTKPFFIERYHLDL